MSQKQNDELPQRKHPAHGVAIVEGQPTIVFDTVNTKDREPWLACDEVHDLLCEIWREATAWLMGRYVIMPDHIHYFAAATESPIRYQSWVRYWKSQFTKRHKTQGNRIKHCRQALVLPLLLPKSFAAVHLSVSSHSEKWMPRISHHASV